MGLVVTRYDRRRISYSQAVRACNHYTFKLKIMIYMEMLCRYIIIGYGLLMLHEGSTFNVLIKQHFIPTTRPIIILLDKLFEH